MTLAYRILAYNYEIWKRLFKFPFYKCKQVWLHNIIGASSFPKILLWLVQGYKWTSSEPKKLNHPLLTLMFCGDFFFILVRKKKKTADKVPIDSAVSSNCSYSLWLKKIHHRRINAADLLIVEQKATAKVWFSWQTLFLKSMPARSGQFPPSVLTPDKWSHWCNGNRLVRQEI